MKFSQRIGINESVKQMQIEGIDQDLRNRLWNVLKLYIIDRVFVDDDNTEYKTFCNILWHEFYKKTVDEIPRTETLAKEYIRSQFLYQSNWFEVYDCLDFMCRINVNSVKSNKKLFKLNCNKVLESEFSAYRFIGDYIVPISNKYEVNEVEEAIVNSLQFTSLKGVNIHLNNALSKFSDKKAPDFRNSIKESISAVESIVKVISNRPSSGLREALASVKQKVNIHGSLEKGFVQLYGYTSDGDGIRHALMDDPNCDFEDAKYMLVSCSSFINYLISKANKTDIPLS